MVPIRRAPSFALLVALVASVLGVSTPTAGAVAATFTVTTTTDETDGCGVGNCSLRDAVNAANGTPDPDTIVLPAGSYQLNPQSSLPTISAPLTITGAGAATTEVVGDEIGATGFGARIMAIDSAAQAVVLSGFTIRGGDATTAVHTFPDGGGILSSAPLTLNGMRLHDNTTQSGFVGGGLWTESSTTINASTISSNAATHGGGIKNFGSLTMAASTVTGNATIANDFFDGDGGGIHNEGAVTITSSTFSGNSAVDSGDGGGLYNSGTSNPNDGNATVALSTFSGNSANFGGAGVANHDTATIISSTFAGNFSPLGGGVLNSGIATITTSTLSGNSGFSFGGGIYNSFGAANIASSTVSGNVASGEGGGIYNVVGGGGGGGSATVTSSIVIANTSTTNDDCSTVSTNGFNVFGSGTGCPQGGTSDVSISDASFLGPLGNNGGPTQTHTIAAGSVPVGRAAADPACDGTTTDQRGVPRSNDACDSGAYELAFCRGVLVNVVGTSGKDALSGTPGPDGILALGGNDKAKGGAGKDGICGGTGKDKLSGGAGKDKLDGGPGNDVCIGGSGNDQFKSCETANQ